ncbi:unnamed protein product [Vicia faba]|uniref:Uncharacterized protein n=1 Tax=Vicia faba TaxID=3906 RepID=A0AAV0ZFR8_VICFA|nr:unnamed protein product [Vicia faba]
MNLTAKTVKTCSRHFISLDDYVTRLVLRKQWIFPRRFLCKLQVNYHKLLMNLLIDKWIESDFWSGVCGNNCGGGGICQKKLADKVIADRNDGDSDGCWNWRQPEKEEITHEKRKPYYILKHLETRLKNRDWTGHGGSNHALHSRYHVEVVRFHTND